MTITKSKEMIIDEKQHESEPSTDRKPDGEFNSNVSSLLILICFFFLLFGYFKPFAKLKTVNLMAHMVKVVSFLCIYYCEIGVQYTKYCLMCLILDIFCYMYE